MEIEPLEIEAAAAAPEAELLVRVAELCGWPSVDVDCSSMGRPRFRIAARRLAWEGFMRWADDASRLAAWQALEDWERTMQAEFTAGGTT